MFEDFLDPLRGLVQLFLIFSLFADRCRDMLAQLQILRAQTLGQLHQLRQFLFEGVEFALHGRTIEFKSLLSQSITRCFASVLELSLQRLMRRVGRLCYNPPRFKVQRGKNLAVKRETGAEVFSMPVLPPQR